MPVPVGAGGGGAAVEVEVGAGGGGDTGVVGTGVPLLGRYLTPEAGQLEVAPAGEREVGC